MPHPSHTVEADFSPGWGRVTVQVLPSSADPSRVLEPTGLLLQAWPCTPHDLTFCVTLGNSLSLSAPQFPLSGRGAADWAQ